MGVALAALLIDNLPKIDVGMAGLKNIDYVCASLRGCARSGFGLTGCAISGPMLSASFFLSRSMGHLMRSPIWTGQWNSWLRSTACLGESAAEPDRDGQYFHYLAMWLYALGVLGRYEPAYRDKGIARVPSTGLSSCRAAVLSGK
jgi:hypothetical protein